MHSRGRSVAVGEAIGTVIIWGATFVATKIALQEVSPATIVWLRFGMGLAVLGVAAAQRRELAPPSAKDWPYLALLGFNGVALHQWLQANGLLTAQATTTAWIVAATPVFIALLGWLALTERLSLLQIGGMALAAAGVILVVSKGQPALLLEDGQATAGDILILVSAVNWAVYTILSRQGLTRLPAAKMVFYVMLSGWMFVSAWLFASGIGVGEIHLLTFRGWLAIAALGLFGSGLAYVMYYDALSVLPASQLGAFLNIEPLVTMFLAAKILGEPITLIVLLGGVMILGGVYLVNRSQAGAGRRGRVADNGIEAP